ncbi:MAG: M48 family metallopeptidase [Clostridia bacterium]|nr:M48 family metallopeptidase [Clostridia bacterium]
MNEQELLIPTKIIKSKRKSISLIIKNNGEFIVRSPLNCAEKKIFDFINTKKEWIIKKRIEQLSNPYEQLQFNKDETLNILNKQYNIVLTEKTRVKLNENSIEVPKENSKAKLIGFLKAYSKKHFNDRARLMAQLFNFSYTKITISSAKTCWGSCGGKNILHFTYKLIMCPEDVVDYVILHELCHTKIKNHSKKFWLLVENCNPNYKNHEKWLKKNRGIIDVI